VGPGQPGQQHVAKQETAGGAIAETIKTIVYALLIAGVFRTLFFQPFWIPSGSMKDTLLIGDFLFVNKMAYGYSRYSCPFAMCPVTGRILGAEPERGDVAVFRHPVTGVDFIKRVVGLPGDRIQMREGVLYINDVASALEPDGQFVETFERQGPMGTLPICANQGVGLGGDCIKDRYIETLPGGASHAILDVRDSVLDNTPIYTVPAGNYFFMGDNRDNSNDSRVMPPNGLGFVPHEYLIGRADRVMFSSAGRSLFFFWTWRSDRFFAAID
jgi:signal peptidase I